MIVECNIAVGLACARRQTKLETTVLVRFIIAFGTDALHLYEIAVKRGFGVEPTQ